MRKSPVCVLIFAALLGTAAVTTAFASGSYSGRPPQPPAKAAKDMKLDQEKFGLGQKVYEGGVMTPNGGAADAQAARLKALQMKLPADAAKTKDLGALAGKLSEAQLGALEYFVEQRFGMKQ